YFSNIRSSPPIHTLSLHDALPIYKTQGPRATLFVGAHRVDQNLFRNTRPRRQRAQMTYERDDACDVVSSGETRFMSQKRGGHHSDRKSTRLNSSHLVISYAVFCLK